MIKVMLLIATIHTLSLAISAEDMVNQYGCMECHGIQKGRTAPAFRDIAIDAPKERIKESIKNGSQGKYKKFAQNIMPEFDYFSQKELNEIADWIKILK